jgi:ParD-like antitoxin of type II bacterial toxin-antitoxin system
MPSPVKVSDRLLALAKKEAESTHRSATAQIEHWATLGRAVEVMAAYRDVLALKRAGDALPVPAYVSRQAVHDLLTGLVHDVDRETVKARILAAGTPLYTTDPEHPGLVVEVQADDARTAGRLLGRRFVPARRAPVRLVAARRKSSRRAR